MPAKKVQAPEEQKEGEVAERAVDWRPADCPGDHEEAHVNDRPGDETESDDDGDHTSESDAAP